MLLEEETHRGPGVGHTCCLCLVQPGTQTAVLGLRLFPRGAVLTGEPTYILLHFSEKLLQVVSSQVPAPRGDVSKCGLAVTKVCEHARGKVKRKESRRGLEPHAVVRCSRHTGR